MKRRLTLLVIKVLPTKTTVRYYNSIIMIKMKQTSTPDRTKGLWAYGAVAFSYTAGGNVKG